MTQDAAKERARYVAYIKELSAEQAQDDLAHIQMVQCELDAGLPALAHAATNAPPIFRGARARPFDDLRRAFAGAKRRKATLHWQSGLLEEQTKRLKDKQ